MRRRKTFFAKIGLALFGIFLALAVSEIFIGHFFPQQLASDIAPYKFNCFIKGDYYWLKFKPNSNCLLRSYADNFEDVYIKTNSLGIRNAEINPKRENTLRVLFVGDSETVGWGVKEVEAFPKVVENNLQRIIPDKKIESINAALAGSGIGYDYLFYKNEGIKLDSDILVVGFYPFNDIPENSFLSTWVEDQSGLPIKINSTYYYVDSDGMFYPQTNPLKYRVSFLRESHLFLLLMNQLPDIHPEFKFNPKFISPYVCFYKKACHDLDEAKLKVKKLFSALKDLTKKNNQKLLVVLIPAEFQINRHKRINYLPVPLLPSEYDYPYQYFGSFFDSIGVDYLDLRPTLKSYANDTSFYLTNDDHLNAAGHAVIGKAVSEKLYNMIQKP